MYNDTLFFFCVAQCHLISVRTFGFMDDHTFSEIANHQIRHIRPHKKWVISLVIAYGQFNFPQGFVWVYMG